jgi:hypothetical protein
MLPPDPDSCADARRAAEDAGDDAALLRLRRLERAYTALPPLIDGARRDRLVWADAISTVWLGWDVHSGQRLVLRCLRPFWRDDPVMRRRLARACAAPPEGILPLTERLSGDWPHLRAVLPGPLLAERRCADPAALAGALTVALRGIRALHATGRWLGGDLLDQIAVSPEQPALIWLDRFDPPGSFRDDLVSVGALAAALDPEGQDPLGRLVCEWETTPPPTAEVAVFLLKRAMAAALLSERYRLRTTQHRHALRGQRLRLEQLLDRLCAMLPPPLSVCLSAPPDQPPTLLVSDGHTLRGGQVDLDALPVVASPGSIDVFACRALLRSARTHRRRDDERRDQLDTTLGGDEASRAAALRWIRARLRLRSLSLLLAKQLRQSSNSTDSR